MDDLEDYLQANGITAAIQKGSLPESPDTALAFRETGGFPGQYVMKVAAGNAVIEEPTVQVLARAKAYDVAEVLIRSVSALLDGLRNQTINGVQYHWVRAMQPPSLLERDQNQRFVLVFNVHIKRQTVP
jgi:hypothetical protein